MSIPCSSDNFSAFVRNYYPSSPNSFTPGEFVRFPSTSKPGDKSGWAKLFPDTTGGTCGDWITNDVHTWQKKRNKPMSPGEKTNMGQTN